MDNTVDYALYEETTAWCGRAEEAVGDLPAECCECCELVREGILLRRRWDRIDADAPLRRQLMRLLPAVQTIAQHRLTETIDDPGSAASELVSLVLGQLDEDDEYLMGLLNDDTHSPESVAFAVECFRDDLHWLSALVAVLDGSRGVDFLGRVLLEEEALEREMHIWENERSSPAAGPGTALGSATGVESVHAVAAEPTADSEAQAASPPPADSRATVSSVLDELRTAAHRLRATAIARQVESLLEQPDPDDWLGWFHTWQAASRLAIRLDPELLEAGPAGLELEQGADELPAGQPSAGTPSAGIPSSGTLSPSGALSADAMQSVEAFRKRAADRWNACVAELPAEQGSLALKHAAEELSDTGSETLTFLEDLSLESAVRSLEILEDDVAACRQALKRQGGQGLRGPGRALRREQAAIAGELQERRLAWRMESLFGRGFVTALERLILVLLFLFVIMLIVERPLLRYEAAHWQTAAASAHTLVQTVFAWTDLTICLVFLTEFTLKMALARRRWLYFRRNWLTGLLPSIPFGFIGYAVAAGATGLESVLLLRLLRYLRLPRMARWLRIARPVLRIMRLVGFLLKASDRLVRQLTPLVNRNLVLFERAAVAAPEPPYRSKLTALRERFYYRAAETIHFLPASGRCQLAKARIADLTAMLSSPQVAQLSSVVPAQAAPAREIPVEGIVNRLLSATPAGISDRIGHTLAHSVSRWCRALDVVGLRRLPLVQDLVSASRLPSPYETTARVANRIGLLLEHLLDRVYWMADLYGTVTSPQLVDSIGERMVKGTERPTRRLFVLGAAFLAVWYLARLTGIPTLEHLSVQLWRLVEALWVLALLCAVPLLLGLWFRRIAGEATEFYRQVAAAQFITATKTLKRRLAEEQHDFLVRRTIAPEEQMAAGGGPSADEPADSVRAAVERLWEEYLDSPPFHESDTATTSQLLGNLTLVSLRETRLGYTPTRSKRLRQLDIANTRFSLRGPHLWFHFVTRSIGHQTAKLVESYNAFALPLSRAATAEDWEIRRYVRWLEKRLGRPADEFDLPPALRQRYEALSPQTGKAAPRRAPLGRFYQGNDFTAIHFLSADEELEADVRRRYGNQVADLMRRDRRDNFRRVFRTYPFHRWPKQRRTFNPLVLYQRHLAGGRVLLLPLKMVVWGTVLLARAVRLVGGIVREVRNPHVRELSLVEDPDPFEVARRKIHRMRKPLFLECLRMRAEFDPEYLGIVPPGASAGVGESSVVQVQDDLSRIGADPSVKHEFRQLATARRRQMIELRRWLRRFGHEGLSRSSLRAMAIAYTIDYRGVRTRLEAAGLLERTFNEAIADQARRQCPPALRGGSLASLWCGLANGRRLRRLFRQPTFRHLDRRQRAACRRRVCRERGPLLLALGQLTTGRRAGEDPVEDARRELSEVARDPDPWSRQLVTLRAVQTLSVLNLDTYCKLVYDLGEYAAYPADGTQPPAPGP
ncbi:MAG TPA: ion transporter [Thermoguttaceae bacterium]|nr:ion transporter [Thermoguttaceae bacterium]